MRKLVVCEVIGLDQEGQDVLASVLNFWVGEFSSTLAGHVVAELVQGCGYAFEFARNIPERNSGDQPEREDEVKCEEEGFDWFRLKDFLVVGDERVVVVCEGVEITTKASNADNVESDACSPQSELDLRLIDVFAE